MMILEECSSTNDVAKAFARAGAPHGLVVAAEKQTHGRGRYGRRWISPPGGIWLTVLLRPPQPYLALEGIPLLGAYAVAQGVRRMTGLEAAVRWPNDVTIDDMKVSGVLAESEFIGALLSFVALGLGINANFRASLLGSLARKATTIRELVGRNIDPASLVSAVLRELENSFEIVMSGRSDDLVRRIERMDNSLGRRISVFVNGKNVVGVLSHFEGLSAVRVMMQGGLIERVQTSAVHSVRYLDALN